MSVEEKILDLISKSEYEEIRGLLDNLDPVGELYYRGRISLEWDWDFITSLSYFTQAQNHPEYDITQRPTNIGSICF